MKHRVAQRGDPRNPKIDAVDWVERIPLAETRNYVQRVMEKPTGVSRPLGTSVSDNRAQFAPRRNEGARQAVLVGGSPDRLSGCPFRQMRADLRAVAEWFVHLDRRTRNKAYRLGTGLRGLTHQIY